MPHRYDRELFSRRARLPRRASDGLLTDKSTRGVTAAAWAEEQTAAVRDDPAARIALVERCYGGPFGRAPRHLPYRRAAMSFMRWQLRRGVLEPAHSSRPGSPWWRAVNERLLRDGCEAVALSGGLAGPASSRPAGYWLSFADDPTARAWYRAHNSSVVAAYLEHRDLAEAENAAERFFMNVVLCRVLSRGDHDLRLASRGGGCLATAEVVRPPAGPPCAPARTPLRQAHLDGADAGPRRLDAERGHACRSDIVRPDQYPGRTARHRHTTSLT